MFQFACAMLWCKCLGNIIIHRKAFLYYHFLFLRIQFGLINPQHMTEKYDCCFHGSFAIAHLVERVPAD